MPRTFLLTAVFITGELLSCPAWAQPVTGVANGQTQAAAIALLTVSIDSGDSSRCMATGFVVGYDEHRAYVVSSSNSLADALPNGSLHLSSRIGAAPPRPTPPDRPAPPLPLRRVSAQIVKLDEPSNLVILSIDDAVIMETLRGGVRFEVAGSAADLVPSDRLYGLGCTGAESVARWSLRALATNTTNGTTLAFDGSDLTPQSTGGPVVHALGEHSTIVGMTFTVRERAEAVPLNAIVEHLKEWKIPMLLIAPDTNRMCSYSVTIPRATSPSATAPRQLRAVLSSTAWYALELQVDTASGCSWSAYGDGSKWLRVTSRPAVGGQEELQRGPGSVLLMTRQANLCRAQSRRAAVYVAGRIIQVSQDGVSRGLCQ